MFEYPTVLLADDDLAMRSMLALSLAREGLHVDDYDSGDALLERLADVHDELDRPDLVISDVQMPGATGLDILHWIHRELPDVPVILITAFGDRIIHERARQLGAAAVLDKPFDLRQLCSLARKILRARQGRGHERPPLATESEAAPPTKQPL